MLIDATTADIDGAFDTPTVRFFFLGRESCRGTATTTTGMHMR